MAREVDELFGEGEGAPTPRSALVWTLLVSGLLLSLVGLLCTSAPGGILVLLAWSAVEKEMDRVDNGYLPAEARPTVARMRTATYVGLVLVVLVFVVQGWLFCLGFYEHLWERMLEWAGSYLSAPQG